jgi:hypothetical protein
MSHLESLKYMPRILRSYIDSVLQPNEIGRYMRLNPMVVGMEEAEEMAK